MTTPTTNFKNITDLFNLTAGFKLYVALPNGYYLPATKSSIKLLANTMNDNGALFCGEVSFYHNSGRTAHITVY